jgi:hypothetical protein
MSVIPAWTHPVALADIPATGLHVELEPTASERTAIAAQAGVDDLKSVRAVFDLVRGAGDAVRVTGVVVATVGQTCVVTLDPIENTIEESLDVRFAPEGADAIAAAAKAVDVALPEEDPPEPARGGRIDLGELAVEFLILGVDPYPRKPGAAFEPPVIPPDPADHPFAALEKLKRGQ